MNATAVAPRSVRSATVAGARSGVRRRRYGSEPLVIFVVATVGLAALGLRTTVGLHLVYPDALTRLDHAFIAWWDTPARFASVGFMYPPLQTVVLLPFALIRPLASSLAALPLFSAGCAGVTLASLDRALASLGLARSLRLGLLAVFAVNPVFLDYGSNGTATCLTMALLALALANLCAFYVSGGASVRALGMCGLWFAIGFLARYEMGLWLALVTVAVGVDRIARRASWAELLAFETILLAPFTYIFLIWSAVSALVGGGSVLSWITRAGAEHVAGSTFGSRHSFPARAVGVLDVLWRISPLLLVVPVLCVLLALRRRRSILLLCAASILVGAAAAILRMWVLPNPILLTPGYQMLALVPMVVGIGALLHVPATGPRPRGLRRGAMGGGVVAILGVAVAIPGALGLLRHDTNVYDRGFATALSSRLTRIGASRGAGPPGSPSSAYADTRGLITFLQAAHLGPQSVLLDDLAFPGLVLGMDSALTFRTRAELGDRAWRRLLASAPGRGTPRYLVVANPAVAAQGYPTDLVTEHLRHAYDGGLPGARVIFANPLAAIVELTRVTGPQRASTAGRPTATRPTLSPATPTRPTLSPAAASRLWGHLFQLSSRYPATGAPAS